MRWSSLWQRRHAPLSGSGRMWRGCTRRVQQRAGGWGGDLAQSYEDLAHCSMAKLPAGGGGGSGSDGLPSLPSHTAWKLAVLRRVGPAAVGMHSQSPWHGGFLQG